MEEGILNNETPVLAPPQGDPINLTTEERVNILKLLLRVKLDGNEAHEFVRIFDKIKFGK